MKNKDEKLEMTNIIATVVFIFMAVIGIRGIFASIDFEPLNNQTISFATLFIVGSFGLIVELLVYNLKSLKK